MIDNGHWEDPRSIPKDGRPVKVIFHDHKGEYPGFPVRWDADAKCWRNNRCGTVVMATISGWREYEPRRPRQNKE